MDFMALVWLGVIDSFLENELGLRKHFEIYFADMSILKILKRAFRKVNMESNWERIWVDVT